MNYESKIEISTTLTMQNADPFRQKNHIFILINGLIFANVFNTSYLYTCIVYYASWNLIGLIIGKHVVNYKHAFIVLMYMNFKINLDDFTYYQMIVFKNYGLISIFVTFLMLYEYIKTGLVIVDDIEREQVENILNLKGIMIGVLACIGIYYNYNTFIVIYGKILLYQIIPHVIIKKVN